MRRFCCWTKPQSRHNPTLYCSASCPGQPSGSIQQPSAPLPAPDIGKPNVCPLRLLSRSPYSGLTHCSLTAQDMSSSDLLPFSIGRCTPSPGDTILPFHILYISPIGLISVFFHYTLYHINSGLVRRRCVIAPFTAPGEFCLSTCTVAKSHCSFYCARLPVLTASSGIAVLLLPGSHTAHSTFHLPVENILPDSTCNISKEDKCAELLRSVDLIIWDEAPTQSRFIHEALDHTLRDICDNDLLPFAGKTVVLRGDFQQTLPVIPNGSPEDVINVSLPRSYLWKHIQVLPLPTYDYYIVIEPFTGPQSPYKHATIPINRRRAQLCKLVT